MEEKQQILEHQAPSLQTSRLEMLDQAISHVVRAGMLVSFMATIKTKRNGSTQTKRSTLNAITEQCLEKLCNSVYLETKIQVVELLNRLLKRWLNNSVINSQSTNKMSDQSRTSNFLITPSSHLELLWEILTISMNCWYTREIGQANRTKSVTPKTRKSV